MEMNASYNGMYRIVSPGCDLLTYTQLTRGHD